MIDAGYTSSWDLTELGRLECRKDFPYGRISNSIGYDTKQVRPIFDEEVSEIVVVAVYVYYS